MNISKLSSKNPDGSPKPTFREAVNDLNEGKVVDPTLAKTLQDIASRASAVGAFERMTKPPEFPPIRPMPRPLSRNDMAELMEQQQEEVKTMKFWTVANGIVAILALIVAVLAFLLK